MKKRIFFTADWHLGHRNCLAFDNRPFSSINDMEKGLIKRFNATVPPGSLTYFLGDMGRSPRLPEVLDQLNGEHVLILGNHDGKLNAMHQKGFSVVLNTASLIIAGQLVTMSHCPLKNVFREDVSEYKHSKPTDHWHREHANQNFTVNDFGQFHLHGHVHFHPNDPVKTNRQWDVGVVGNNYTPISISAVESWICRTLRSEKENA